jgi:hypothetical protein
MRGRVVLAVLLLLLPLTNRIAGAQPPPPPLGRTEISAGFAFVAPALDTALITAYTPPFRSAIATASRAGQTLQIVGENGIGVELGGAVFLTPAVGIQVLFAADSFDVGGVNEPHSAHLEYISRVPPDYTPRPTVVDRDEEWPDTTGELDQRTLSFNAVGRGRLGRIVVGEVSGGLSYFRMDGETSPLGYAAFTLGGHSTLSYELAELEVDLGPASSWGFNFGGGIDVELARTVALTADFRYFRGGTITAPVTVSQVLNADEVIMQDPLETIQDTVQPAAVELKPTRVRFLAGLKIRF